MYGRAPIASSGAVAAGAAAGTGADASARGAAFAATPPAPSVNVATAATASAASHRCPRAWRFLVFMVSSLRWVHRRTPRLIARSPGVCAGVSGACDLHDVEEQRLLRDEGGQRHTGDGEHGSRELDPAVRGRTHPLRVGDLVPAGGAELRTHAHAV